MDIGGCKIVESKMWAVVVVEMDSLLGGSSGLVQVNKETVQSIFEFEDAIDAFSEGILVTVSDLTHAHANVALVKQVAIRVSRVLDAVVAVVDQASQRAGGLSQGHVESPLAALDGQGERKVKADDEAREGVGQQGKVGKAGLQGQVGDVADPELMPVGERQLWEQIGTAPQPRTGGLGTSPFDRHQQTM